MSLQFFTLLFHFLSLLVILVIALSIAHCAICSFDLHLFVITQDRFTSFCYYPRSIYIFLLLPKIDLHLFVIAQDRFTSFFYCPRSIYIFFLLPKIHNRALLQKKYIGHKPFF